jgi:hypothetical protein
MNFSRATAALSQNSEVENPEESEPCSGIADLEVGPTLAQTGVGGSR